jgi:hypothetical protein
MLEAYFFADQNAILKATARSSFEIVSGRDLEEFESCDAAYLQKHSTLPKSQSPFPILPSTQEWFAKHPKEYVRHLSTDPQGGVVTYREATQGAEALKELCPVHALAVTTQRRFLRSMVNDLADALNTEVSLAFQGVCHPVTSRHAQANRVLRNI